MILSRSLSFVRCLPARLNPFNRDTGTSKLPHICNVQPRRWPETTNMRGRDSEDMAEAEMK